MGKSKWIWNAGEFVVTARPKTKGVEEKGGAGSGRTAGHGFGGNQWVKVGGEGVLANPNDPVKAMQGLQRRVRASCAGFDKTVYRTLDKYNENQPTSGRKEEREALKDAVADEIAARSGLSYERSNAMIKTWAKSSTDTEPDSIALQMAVAAKFNINPGAYLSERAAYMAGGFRDVIAAGPPPVRNDIDNSGNLLMGQDSIMGHSEINPSDYNENWNDANKAFSTAILMSMELDKTTTFIIPKEYATTGSINHGYGDFPFRPFPGYGLSVYTHSEGFKEETLPNGDLRFTRDNTLSGPPENANPASFESQPIDLEQRMSDAAKVVDAMYAHTQEVLAASDIKELTVFRGMHFHADDPEPPEALKPLIPTSWEETTPGHPRDTNPQAVEIDLNPISSFSVNSHSAEDFAGGGVRGLVFATTVPAERVFSLPSTGLGCLREGEVVVIGGPTKAVASVKNVAGWNTSGAEPPHHIDQSRFYNR
jgi:hypothetical protein